MESITLPPFNEKSIQHVKLYPSVTIIVAATQYMGMSYKGRLPWPKIPCESEYFHTTSKRVVDERCMNAVIMGYKTWDRMPTKYYPGRINVVVTRKPEKALARLRGDERGVTHVVRSVEDAVEMLEKTYSYPPTQDEEFRNSSLENGNNGPGMQEDGLPYLGRIFVIGGAGICREALELPYVDRILLTRVVGNWKSDTFFPLAVDKMGTAQWRRESDEAFRKLFGEEVPIGVQYENGLEWEAFMLERV